MGKKRIVIDTNVLISSLGWAGKPRAILNKVLDEEYELIISQKQIEELQRVLEYPKLKFTESQKLKFIDILLSVAILVETHGHVKIIETDPSDNIILESALENGAEYIISGDQDLLCLKAIKKVKIVTPSQFLDQMND